jgi:hypothetical protein
MPQKRHTLLLALTALALAGAVAAQTPPGFRELFQQGASAYEKKDWPVCAERFGAAAAAATHDREAARAHFAAASCLAAAGNKEAAFARLDKAAARGYRDLERASANQQVEPLRADPRWKAFQDGVKARSEAHEATLNAELTRICAEDQADRQGGKIDWRVVGKRDAERLKRVKEIADQGGLKQADDYFHAALVLQHSDHVEDYQRAHEWCLKAVELDPEYPSARWLAAATLDRSLMNQGKPQLYGTQFKKVDNKWVLWQVDPTITDEERAKWDVPPLAESRKREESMNLDFFALYDRASNAYEKADWSGCAQQFANAASAADLDRQASRAWVAAAACAAKDKDKAGVFYCLDQAAAHGVRDVDRLATHPDFATVRDDPRWKPLFEKAQARAAAARKGPLNADLERLYNEDQADRAADLDDSAHWQAVEKRDAERRKRVLEIVEKGGVKEAADYLHAAMVYQHGATPEDYDRAYQWAAKAAELDPDYPGARWLTAAAKDRYLMKLGKPQLYGTQFQRVNGTGPWILWNVDPSITDEERAKWDVPPLARAKARAEALNAGTFQPH